MVILTVVVSVFSVELDVVNDSDDERLHGDVSCCQDLSPGVSFVNDEHSVTFSSTDSSSPAFGGARSAPKVEKFLKALEGEIMRS